MGYSKLTITMHKCAETYSEPEIQNLDDLKPEPERSSWRRDEKVNADGEASIFFLVCKDYVELFSVKADLKVFCIGRLHAGYLHMCIVALWTKIVVEFILQR